MSIGYLADTGSWSESMAESLADVDVLGVEFNHDVAMQKSSGRSALLIARNLGDHGHLSNRQGAELVEAVLARSGRGSLAPSGAAPPERAVQSTRPGHRDGRNALGTAGRKVDIHAAQQSPAHPNLWIAPGRRSSTPERTTVAVGLDGGRQHHHGLPTSGGPPVLAGLLGLGS